MRHSGPSRASLRRTVSRKRRRIRFRFTALPSVRGVVNPVFGPSATAAFQQKATNVRQTTLKPSS